MAASFQERGDLMRGLWSRYFTAAANEHGAALELLYRDGIEPRAAAILRHKLRVSLRPDDDSYLNQVALDLLSDVKAALLAVIRNITAGGDARSIGNFDAYVRTAVMNAYHQHIREKYPRRLSLRNKIRYILTHRRAMAMWKGERGEFLCGKTRDQTSLPASASQLEAIAHDIDLQQARADENTYLIAAIEQLFNKVDVPIRLEDLVSILWRLMGLTENEHLSPEDASTELLVSPGSSVQSRFDEIEHLRRLWSAIVEMPLKHRRALLLNLTDGRDDNMIVLFPALGIASVRLIAEALEFDAEEFAEIWNRLPIDDLTIATKMGITRQQVINLRQTARAKLRRATS